jgi:hypothetical protein
MRYLASGKLRRDDDGFQTAPPFEGSLFRKGWHGPSRRGQRKSEMRKSMPGRAERGVVPDFAFPQESL